MWRTGLACLAACLTAIVANSASAITFSAGLDDSSWNTQGDIFECRLKHPIPGYGAAEFITRAGEQASFTLTSWQRPMQKGKAEVVQQPPHWDQFSRAQALGEIKVRSGRQPVRLAGPIPTQMLRALKGGQGAAIRRLSWYDSSEQIDVRLSTVNFQNAYRGYMDCLSSLLPVNFDQIRRSVIYFDSNKELLGETNTEILDSIALYIKADPDVARIVIDGHTDDIGRRLKNRELSRVRAEEVRDYLTRFGLDESMMLVRFHGERYPVVRNNSDKNRALNRRVTLQLKKRYEVERDEQKAARRAKRIEQAIDVGSGAVTPDQSSVPSPPPSARAPVPEPGRAPSPPVGEARQSEQPVEPSGAQPVSVPPSAAVPAGTADSGPAISSEPPSSTAASSEEQSAPTASADSSAAEQANPFAPPAAESSVPPVASNGVNGTDSAAPSGSEPSVLNRSLPTSGLDAARPSSGLDENLPSSGLQSELPASGNGSP